MSTKKTVAKKEVNPVEQEDAQKVRYGTIMLQEQGAKYKTLFTEKYKNRPIWQKPNLKEIYSQIPGTVIKIYVEVGQKVKEGEVMMILEAMKMRNKITFPIDGVVKSINVKEDQRIPKGYLMIELK